MAARQRGDAVAHTCLQCGETYYAPIKPLHKGSPPPQVCGRTLCWAKAYNTPQEWAGRKRMAEALAGAWGEVASPDDLVVYRPQPTAAALKTIDGGSSLDTAPRWALPGWSALDDEAMSRG